MPADPEPTILVSYYVCLCPWQTKFCDDNHKRTALVPSDVLDCYRVDLATGDE